MELADDGGEIVVEIPLEDGPMDEDAIEEVVREVVEEVVERVEEGPAEQHNKATRRRCYNRSKLWKTEHWLSSYGT